MVYVFGVSRACYPPNERKKGVNRVCLCVCLLFTKSEECFHHDVIFVTGFNKSHVNKPTQCIIKHNCELA